MKFIVVRSFITLAAGLYNNHCFNLETIIIYVSSLLVLRPKKLEHFFTGKHFELPGNTRSLLYRGTFALWIGSGLTDKYSSRLKSLPMDKNFSLLSPSGKEYMFYNIDN